MVKVPAERHFSAAAGLSPPTGRHELAVERRRRIIGYAGDYERPAHMSSLQAGAVLPRCSLATRMRRRSFVVGAPARQFGPASGSLGYGAPLQVR